MWDNGGFDIYGYSIGPDYEDMILARQEAQEDCSGDCCHCFYASVCDMCDDGGIQ